jgi:serine/threonine protein kinase
MQTLGDFELIRELGRGGMGVVYEARQISLNRRVALKVLKVGLGLTTQAVTRFQREAAAAAKLHHTNIVPIYSTGEDGDHHFYAMELIEGTSLDRVIRTACAQGTDSPAEFANPEAIKPGLAKDVRQLKKAVSAAAGDLAATELSGAKPEGPSDKPDTSTTTLSSGAGYFDNVARLFAEIADALDHAHQQGVIHRDIKPSNLLFSRQGRLHLTDFGLARVLEEPGMTVTGEFMGSPLYMSPEQIAAGRAPLDHRTDIYSLGATLYETLTLQPPFQGERRDQIIAQILHKEPKPPRTLDRRIPQDLETICLKAMDKDPDRRYQTGKALAEDLDRYLKRFAISARRAGPIQRTVNWARRHPALALAMAAVFVACMAALFFANQSRLSERKRLAEEQQSAVEKAFALAMSGDFKSANQAIDAAELLHTSPGQIHMLRGELELHQGNNSNAVEHLKQSVRLLPASVAARALLASAYIWDGQWDNYDATVTEMERLTPSTPQDYLFKGQAEIYGEPERALPVLDEAVRLLPNSPLARMIRAEARSGRATDSGSPADAQAAIDDMEMAKAWLPGNAYGLEVSLWVHLTAAVAFGDAGQHDREQAAWAQGERDCKALEAFPDLPTAVTYRFSFLHGAGRRGTELESLRQASVTIKDNLVGYFNALVLYEEGKFEPALEAMDRNRKNREINGDSIRALILAELPDATTRLQQAFQEYTNYYRSATSWAPIFPLLLGAPAQSRAQSLELVQQTNRLPRLRREFYLCLAQYQAGMLPESAFLKSLGVSRWNQIEGQFFIALTHLAEGDRAGAREHLRLAIASHVNGYVLYDWSPAFIKRLETDPNWPPWIPPQRTK